MTLPPADAVTVQQRVVRASLWVTAGMLIGRVAGMIREFLVADTFGVSRNADVVILLISGPDMLVTIAGSGAVGLVLIPILLELDVETQLQVVRRLTIRLGTAASVLAAVVAFFVSQFGSGWASNTDLETSEFTIAVVIAACAIPTSMMVVVTAAFLRAQDRFAVVSFSTLTFTLPVLVAIVATRSVVGVATGIAIGAVLRYAAQAGLIVTRWKGQTVSGTTRLPIGWADAAAAFGISIMMAAQVSAPLLLAAFFGREGDVALFNYGWRVLLIPVSVLGSLFSVAAYPSIVRLLTAEGGRTDASVSDLTRPVVLFSLAVGVWLFVNAPDAVDAVYGPAGLDSRALEVVSDEIRAGAVAIPLITVGSAATTVLFGMRRTGLGLLPYVLASTALAVLGVMLVRSDGAIGLLWSMVAYASVYCVCATVVLVRSSGLSVIGARQLPATAMSVALIAALALVIGWLVPGQGLLSVTTNGVVFVAVVLGLHRAVDGRLTST